MLELQISRRGKLRVGEIDQWEAPISFQGPNHGSVGG